MNWQEIGTLESIPPLGSRVVASPEGDIAVFRLKDDRILAVYDVCPHKRGPLSQGIVHGHSVTCPLHNWVIDLTTGIAEAPDEGCTRKVAVKVTEGVIWLQQSDETVA
jgi:nitrite reductase (NADH) small subunit